MGLVGGPGHRPMSARILEETATGTAAAATAAATAAASAPASAIASDWIPRAIPLRFEGVDGTQVVVLAVCALILLGALRVAIRRISAQLLALHVRQIEADDAEDLARHAGATCAGHGHTCDGADASSAAAAPDRSLRQRIH